MADTDPCCGIDQNTLITLIQGVINGMIANGSIQAALLGCDGGALGKARVPTCADRQNDLASIENSIAATATAAANATSAASQKASSDLATAMAGVRIYASSAFTGQGTEASLLDVNPAAQKQAIDDEVAALTKAGKLVATDDSLAGTGDPSAPVRLNPLPDGSLTGILSCTVDEVSTTVIGDVTATLGNPATWINLGNGRGVPVFRITAAPPATAGVA